MTPQHSWHPDKEVIENSNIHKMMLQNGFNDYAEFWKWTASDKPEFWKQTLSNLGIRLKRKYDRIVDLSQGEERAQWIPGAQLNIVDSCFQNADDSTAVVFQEEKPRMTLGQWLGSRSQAAPAPSGSWDTERSTWRSADAASHRGASSRCSGRDAGSAGSRTRPRRRSASALPKSSATC